MLIFVRHLAQTSLSTSMLRAARSATLGWRCSKDQHSTLPQAKLTHGSRGQSTRRSHMRELIVRFGPDSPSLGSHDMPPGKYSDISSRLVGCLPDLTVGFTRIAAPGNVPDVRA